MATIRRRTKLQEALRSSLLTRFTAVFLVTILLPSLAILAYSIWDTGRNTADNVMVTSRSIAEDVFESVDDAFASGNDLARELAFDSSLRRFLDDDFRNSGDAVVGFLRTIRPILDYAVRFKGSGIDGARVVMTNPTQPESWPYFVSERRMLATSWYRDFLDSEEPATWIYPNTGGVFSEYDLQQIVRRPVYTRVRKIFDFQGRYLGSVIVDVLETEVHASMHDLALSTIDFAIVEPGGQFSHAAVHDSHRLDEQEWAAWTRELRRASSEQADASNESGATVIESGGRYAYLWRPLGDPDLLVTARIHMRSQVIESASSKLLVGLVIVLGVITLEFVTYLILKNIFSRLSTMTATMNRVAGGEFHHRIPVTTQDEIGQIAEDFNVLIRRIDELVTESVRRETAQKDTQLKALQFQINPHFIYNTIDTFRMRAVMAGDDDLADGLASFGKLIRYNVDGGTLFTTLSEELLVVEQYTALQQLRYEGQIRLDTSRCREQANASILKFVLQPLVENSVRHGKRDGEPIHIAIEGVRTNDHLSVSVHDDGVGVPAERLRALHEHLTLNGSHLDVDGENAIGLANIATRLELFYGTRAAMHVTSEPGAGTSVELVLPLVHRAER